MELIDVGVLVTLTADVIYALPQKRVLLFTNTAGAAFDVSNDSSFATHIGPITLVEGKYELSGGFIRATNQGGALCIFKGF
jgi:hypothetical protein